MAFVENCVCDSCGLVVPILMVVPGEFDDEGVICSDCYRNEMECRESDDVEGDDDGDMGDELDIDPMYDYDDSFDEIGYDPYAGAYESECDFDEF